MMFLRYALSSCLLLAPSSAFVAATLGRASITSTAAAGAETAARRGSRHHHPLNKRYSSSSNSDSAAAATKKQQQVPVMADESVMAPKAHGTSAAPVQRDLRWRCDFDTADRICNFNRHYAEASGYYAKTDFLSEAKSAKAEEPVQFYDSVTGRRLFTAPVGRSMADFLRETQSHGWPSFRDAETNWDEVRVLSNGECVSAAGTHLGHNLPDGAGNRYCINLVSVAGRPDADTDATTERK